MYQSGKESEERAPKRWSFKEAKLKIAAYCAYQDRCQQEVRAKLRERGIYGDDAEELISLMITEKFLDEERFAKAFTRGKFSQNHWGRVKITLELKRRDISPRLIQIALKELDPETYWEKMQALAQKKWANRKGKDTFKEKQALLRYLLGKGYEHALAAELIASLEEEN
ncbi:MAG: regulatory protein RecX [Nitritalea sp.]